MFKGSTYRLARLLLLLTAAIVGTTLSVVYRQWMLLLVAVPALIFLFSALFRLHFQNIRKMTFMFNSIENGDYSFKFTEYDAPVSDNLLNLTLNRIKDLLVKAKNEVIDKERYYELILNSVHTGVIVLNETGNVYQINNEARRLIGLPRFTHINQLATIDRSLRELFFAIRGGERKQASYSNERGTVYLAVNASEITIRGKRLRILAVNDINNELDERETESWIRLIRVLTHEIMNSITPITSLSDTLLGMENKVEGEVREGLEAINSTGRSLIRFVEAYRKVTRIPTPRPTSFYVKPFLERMAKLAEPYMQKENASVRLRVTPSDLLVYADEDLIGQVVLNLLKNAAHAVAGKPDGGDRRNRLLYRGRAGGRRRDRQRLRHTGRCGGQYFRSFLYDQAERFGHRPERIEANHAHAQRQHHAEAFAGGQDDFHAAFQLTAGVRSGAALFGIGGLEKQIFDDDVAYPRHQAEENEDEEYGRFSHIGPVDRYRCRLDDRDAGHLLLHFDFRIFELLRQLAVNAECQLLLVLQPVQFDLRRLARNVAVSVHGPGIVLLGFVVLLPRLVEQVLGKGQIAFGLFGAVLGHVRFQLADHRVGCLSSYERILHRGRRGDDAGFLVYGDGYSVLQRVQDKALSAGQRIGIQRFGRIVVLGGENPADQTHRSPDDMTPPRRRQLLST